MLVLLVEDHEDSREAIRLFLKTHGIQVETAVTGLQAVAKARVLRPDIVVMDLGLPGMDGWEAARHLKECLETRHIPIVALSAHALTTDEERARSSGCDDYLRKPLGPDELLAAIRRLRSLFASGGRDSPPGSRDPRLCGPVRYSSGERGVIQYL